MREQWRRFVDDLREGARQWRAARQGRKARRHSALVPEATAHPWRVLGVKDAAEVARTVGYRPHPLWLDELVPLDLVESVPLATSPRLRVTGIAGGGKTTTLLRIAEKGMWQRLWTTVVPLVPMFRAEDVPGLVADLAARAPSGGVLVVLDDLQAPPVEARKEALDAVLDAASANRWWVAVAHDSLTDVWEEEAWTARGFREIALPMLAAPEFLALVSAASIRKFGVDSDKHPNLSFRDAFARRVDTGDRTPLHVVSLAHALSQGGLHGHAETTVERLGADAVAIWRQAYQDLREDERSFLHLLHALDALGQPAVDAFVRALHEKMLGRDPRGYDALLANLAADGWLPRNPDVLRLADLQRRGELLAPADAAAREEMARRLRAFALQGSLQGAARAEAYRLLARLAARDRRLGDDAGAGEALSAIRRMHAADERKRRPWWRRWPPW